METRDDAEPGRAKYLTKALAVVTQSGNSSETAIDLAKLNFTTVHGGFGDPKVRAAICREISTSVVPAVLQHVNRHLVSVQTPDADTQQINGLVEPDLQNAWNYNTIAYLLLYDEQTHGTAGRANHQRRRINDYLPTTSQLTPWQVGDTNRRNIVTITGTPTAVQLRHFIALSTGISGGFGDALLPSDYEGQNDGDARQHVDDMRIASPVDLVSNSLRILDPDYAKHATPKRDQSRPPLADAYGTPLAYNGDEATDRNYNWMDTSGKPYWNDTSDVYWTVYSPDIFPGARTRVGSDRRFLKENGRPYPFRNVWPARRARRPI